MKPILLRKASVLAVDDQRANLVALEAVLGSDYNLLFADSGPEAIALLQARNDIDVILMDLQMPGMDGFEAAARIKQMEGYEDIPVIFITAVYNEDPYIKQGYRAGAVDYFSKPFDPEILKVKLGIYASFRQKADLLRERERNLSVSEELRHVAHKLWASLDTLRVGVVITDQMGRVRWTNTEVLALCRHSDQTEGELSIDSLGWWDSSGHLIDGELATLTAALDDGEPPHNEVIEVRCLNGVSKTVLCSASALHELGGAVSGAVLVFQDLTHRRALEHDLAQQIAKLGSLSRVELQPG